MVRMRVAHLGLDRSTNTPVVVLQEEEGERTLPIWIGASEANAIALELQGVKPERPLTHDLMKHLVAGLGGELRRVVISGIRENTYLAELLIYRAGEVFEVDARPSDSIALALRMHAPIFSNDELLDRSGDGPDTGSPEPSSDPDALKRFLEKLDPQDLGRFQP
jgi:bifunctional DNase/RNase